MKTKQSNAGKVPIKGIIIVVILVFLAIKVGILMPFAARKAYDKIEIGMQAKDVKNVLNVKGKIMTYCEKGNESIYNDDKCYQSILSMPNNPNSKNIDMHIAFMGPVFWRTSFAVTFGKDGRVVEKSSIIGWD